MGKKRLISALLSAAMVVTMVPFLVSADTDPNAPGSFSDLQELIDQGGQVVLQKDYVAQPGEGSLKITHGASINLNGHTIDRNLSSVDDDGHVFVVKGDPNDPEIQSIGTEKYRLALFDNSNGEKGIITGGYAVDGGGIYCDYPSQLSMSDVIIKGNVATSKGGGIYFDERITYSYLTSGKITNNTSDLGGGIYNASRQLVIPGNVEISGNTASSFGGGIFNTNSLRMTAGTVTGNTAGIHGGGIYQHPYESGDEDKLLISGLLTISGNTGDDVYLCSGEKILLDGQLNENARIGVATEDEAPVVFTENFSLNQGTFYYQGPSLFFSNVEGTRVNLDKDSNSSTYHELIIEPNSIEFKGCSVTLDGQIGLNVYADLSALTDEQKASAKVTFVVPGRGGNTQTDTFDASFTETVDNITCYGFTCKLSSIQMAEEIFPVLTYTGGSLTSTKAFSVANYLDSYFKTPGRTDYSAASLVPALAGYGYNVQQYLHELHGWSLGGENGYAEMPNLFNYNFDEDLFDSYKTKIEATGSTSSKTVGESIDSVKYKLILDSTTGIEVTIKLKAGVTSDLTASCTYAGNTFTAVKTGEGEYKIRITGIYLQDLDKMIAITGMVGDSEAFTVNVSALGYAYAGLNNPLASHAKKSAMCTLYEVWSQTNSYLRNKNA